MVRSAFLTAVLFGGGIVLATPGSSQSDPREMREALVRDYPGVLVRERDGRIEAMHGVPLARGASARESADTVRRRFAELLGSTPADLIPGSLVEPDRDVIGVMFDPATGEYKFTLAYYRQERGGLPVDGGELRVLVRNEAGFPAVWVRSSLRNLGDFAIANRGPIADFAPARAAVKAAYPQVDRYSQERAVIWAGSEQSPDQPFLAVSLVAEGGDPAVGEYFKHRMVVDAATGRVVHEEDLIHFEDVVGTVKGNATPGPKAAECAAEIPMPFPYAAVSISGGASSNADAAGAFVIPNPGTTSVNVLSQIRGTYFQVTNAAGANEQLLLSVVPPGPLDILHNLPNTSEFVLAQVNGYVNANEVRDFVLAVHPTYPVISTQTNFPVRVNRTDGFCPGNAWYDGSSINFCQRTSSYGNTSFASVSQHEYGHHLVEMAGSGQAEYGEGMSDCVAMLIADDPGLGYGFFLNQCSSPLRNADNTCQYVAASCSTCGSSSHTCGQLLSGCVWDLREALGASDPVNGLETVRNLTINSILLHVGTAINSQITVDFLTLDDDDANLNNGTPHWGEICGAFGSHGLDCPAVAAILFSYPQGLPTTIPPSQVFALDVAVSPNGATPVPGTGVLHWRNGSAGSFIHAPMTETAPNTYLGQLPAQACGEVVEFYVSADATGFGEVSDPPNGAAAPYVRVVATDLVTEVSLNFETAPGWSVSGTAADGQWNRGVPAGGGTRGDPPTDFDGSGQCYLTDNVAGNSDVDGGDTILTSPAFDLTGMSNPHIRYARWYSNTFGDSPQADVFDVQVSENGGSSWVLLERVGPAGAQVSGGWYLRTFPLSGLINPTAAVRVRFIASDLGNASVVEAAVDALEIFDLVCGPSAPAAPFYPDSVAKNRYISFVPNNGTDPVSFQVELQSGPGLPGILGWVDGPNAQGVSRLTATPPGPRVWTESVVHVADCGIAPGATYAIRGSSDEILFSSDYLVSTTALPSNGRPWADVVGTFDSVAQEWLPPDGTMGGFDITAIVQGFQQGSTAPPTSWIDLHGQVPDGVVNGSDILQAVRAFTFVPYPFPNPSACP